MCSTYMSNFNDYKISFSLGTYWYNSLKSCTSAGAYLYSLSKLPIWSLFLSGTHSCSLIDSLSIHTWVNWTQTASGVFKGYKTTKRKTKTTQQGVACEPPTTSGNCVSSACDRVCMECKQYMQMDKARLQVNLLWLLECISLYLHA